MKSALNLNMKKILLNGGSKKGKEKKESWNQTQGKWGEELALGLLKKQRYRILETRYQTRYGEIDIIAHQGESLYFVEVKLRNDPRFGDPLEHLTKQKLYHLKKAAWSYILKHPKYQRNYYYKFLAIAIRPYDKNNFIECRNIFPIE